MFMKTSAKIKNYLTSVIIQKIQNITMIQKIVVSKRKYKTCGVPIKGFVELKSKMYTFITRQSWI